MTKPRVRKPRAVTTEKATVRVLVKPSTWIRLTRRKRPGSTFDDVIRALLDVDLDVDLEDDEQECLG